MPCNSVIAAITSRPRHGCELLRWACLYVCPIAYLKNRCLNFSKFSVRVNCGVTRSSSDKNAICYVLPVLWMTSRLSAHNLPGKGNTNRAYTQNDSPGGRTEGKVWCLRLPCSPTGICQNSISVSQLHIHCTRYPRMRIIGTYKNTERRTIWVIDWMRCWFCNIWWIGRQRRMSWLQQSYIRTVYIFDER